MFLPLYRTTHTVAHKKTEYYIGPYQTVTVVKSNHNSPMQGAKPESEHKTPLAKMLPVQQSGGSRAARNRGRETGPEDQEGRGSGA